jgi:predicted nuclease of predicted toxin-antitoxin system
MKFLVDECLSPALTAVAHDAGHEAYHVVHRGWSGESDPRILQHLLAEELVLVTNNRDDFLALVQGVDVHPGLVVIVQNVRRSEQVRLFASSSSRWAAMLRSSTGSLKCRKTERSPRTTCPTGSPYCGRESRGPASVHAGAAASSSLLLLAVGKKGDRRRCVHWAGVTAGPSVHLDSDLQGGRHFRGAALEATRQSELLICEVQPPLMMPHTANVAPPLRASRTAALHA